jgi:hypothetical protein
MGMTPLTLETAWRVPGQPADTVLYGLSEEGQTSLDFEGQAQLNQAIVAVHASFSELMSFFSVAGFVSSSTLRPKTCCV